MTTYAQVKDKVDQALVQKEAGNTAFKANEIPKAIRSYYNVILLLKGLNTGNFSFGGGGGGNVRPGIPVTTAVEPKITEVTDEEASKVNANDVQEESDEEEESDNEDDEEEEEEDMEKYGHEAVKKLQAQCYINMATCHSKNNAWDKCKRNAEDALKLDSSNPKAKFRQAQATVRLGEITKGRQLLLDLQKTNDDAAIRNELKILEQAEKAREDKSKTSMRGFINKANPTVPKFEEIVEEKPVSNKEEVILTPPETPEKHASQGSTTVAGKKEVEKQVELPPTPPKTE